METNSIYIVLAIVLIIWFGIFAYVQSVDKRLKSIEQDMKGNENEE